MESPMPMPAAEPIVVPVQRFNQPVPATFGSLSRRPLAVASEDALPLGLDADGDPGQNFYQIEGADTPESIYSYGSPAGAVQIGVKPIGAAPSNSLVATISDFNALQPSDYEIRFTSATDGTVVRKSTNETITFTGAPPIAIAWAAVAALSPPPATLASLAAEAEFAPARGKAR